MLISGLVSTVHTIPLRRRLPTHEPCGDWQDSCLHHSRLAIGRQTRRRHDVFQKSKRLSIRYQKTMIESRTINSTVPVNNDVDDAAVQFHNSLRLNSTALPPPPLETQISSPPEMIDHPGTPSPLDAQYNWDLDGSPSPGTYTGPGVLASGARGRVRAAAGVRPGLLSG